jgi:hypothetical protein
MGFLSIGNRILISGSLLSGFWASFAAITAFFSNIIRVIFLESDYINYNPALNMAAIYLTLII